VREFLALWDEELTELLRQYPNLPYFERKKIIDKLICAYFANKAYWVFISKMMPNSSSGHGRTSTR
jgi:hypothetical protein